MIERRDLSQGLHLLKAKANPLKTPRISACDSSRTSRKTADFPWTSPQPAISTDLVTIARKDRPHCQDGTIRSARHEPYRAWRPKCDARKSAYKAPGPALTSHSPVCDSKHRRWNRRDGAL